jgi:hypothetical protein
VGSSLEYVGDGDGDHRESIRVSSV